MATGQRRWPSLHCRIHSDSVSRFACFHRTQVYGVSCQDEGSSSGVVGVLLKRLWRKHLLNKHSRARVL